jgi:hypothetical protein
MGLDVGDNKISKTLKLWPIDGNRRYEFDNWVNWAIWRAPALKSRLDSL